MRYAAVLLLLIPSLAWGAGFAKQTLFLSQSPVTEGETVRIYGIVSNSDTAKFTGQMIFKEGDAALGSSAVVLDAGAAQTVSISWKPLAGTHNITASLEDTSGKVVENQNESFTINPKPKPAATAAASADAANVESSAGIQDQIGSFSPAAESAVAPVFNTIDSARQGAADTLDTQLAATKPKVTTIPLPGQDSTAPSDQNWFWSIFYTIYFYILTILRFVIGSAAIFYPVIAILFLLFLWKMFRRFRRPSY